VLSIGYVRTVGVIVSEIKGLSRSREEKILWA